MSNDPLISVIMPVYNSEEYVGEAIQSILNQTYKNFEFLIFNDGSTDKTEDIIRSYSDSRIKLLSYDKNHGYVSHLNKGIEISKGEYIARMDADDISNSNRFKIQIEFLKKNPSIIVCGSNYQIHGTTKVTNHPTEPEELKIQLMSACYIAHPTVMIRSEVLKKNKIRYNGDFEPAEDYYLWAELIKLGQLANIKEPLLQYRIHDSQISRTKANMQIEYANQARFFILSYLIPKFSRREGELFLALVKQDLKKEVRIVELKQFAEKLTNRNTLLSFFAEIEFNQFISSKYNAYLKRYFRYRGNYNLKFLNEYFTNTDNSMKIFTRMQKVKFIVKCMFKNLIIRKTA